MLPPVSLNHRLLSLFSMSSSASDRTDAPARSSVPMHPVAVAPSPGGETLNLTADIAKLMEQDPDYQILRKTFALDQGAAGAHARTFASTITERRQTLLETAAFDLRLSSSQMSTSRLELSVRSEDINLSVQSSRFEHWTQKMDVSFGDTSSVQLGDPLVLDLGGQGITTTGIDAGVRFDLTGDGHLEQMSSVMGDSWFLALDWNNNGRIDDGTELFGDQNGASNGFAELARHDANTDGRIDANDAIFSRLRLLRIESDGTQVTQSLEQAKVTSIELGYQNTRKALNVYDRVAQTSSFTREDGSRGEASDVLLGYRRKA